MPLLVAPDAPSAVPQVNFMVSPLYDMFVSLSTMVHPGERHDAWASEIKRDLSPQMREEADYFYTLFENRLVELAVDYPDHGDVEGFFRYLENMAAEDFVFYATGRVMQPSEIAAMSSHPLRLLAALLKLYGGEHRIHDQGWRQALQLLATEADTLRTRLLRLLRTYWQQSYRHQIARLKPAWEESVRERTQSLGPDRLTAVQERFLANRTLPREFPEGYPLEKVQLVPSLFLSMSSMILYGYGQLIIIYDALTSDEHRNAMAHVQRRIVAVARALEDPTRMTILRAIAKDNEYYGSRLAAKCGITPSSISRHMRVLREAGLINEINQDNRVMYELKRDALEKFCEDLHEYL
ncbi:MAG: metalloregulator ArsR/SmtB family transcription factor [Chloroflexota bacterium]|nr:metalloregulator ArsR/SmtB family transcription factor [Chloroflexota bacterium]MDQ5865572.1 metalloregulator ArsR/SmtB family transcription factor [Chloroflexota bacterium]